MPYADANRVEVDASVFSGNLGSSVDDVQALAEAVDALSVTPAASILTATNILTHTGGVSERSTFAGVHFITDGGTITLRAASNATFVADSFFAVTNTTVTALTIDLSPAPTLTFGGHFSGNSIQIPGGQTVLFYCDFATSAAPVANYNPATGTGGVGTGDHPVVLTRDTPSIADLNTLAQESLNDNSGLWVLANDQTATSDTAIDDTVMIRALKSGLLDATNTEISTTAVQKNTVRLQAGTVVRVFSSTDLRVVSTPTVRERAARYPDLPVPIASGSLSLVGQQVLYNTYRNRTAVFDLNLGQTIEVRLPSLQNQVDLAYLNRNDVFCFRNDGTNGTVRVRTFQVGTQFSNTFGQIDVEPGQVLCVSPAPSGAVWVILEFGQASQISTEAFAMNNDWYRDGVDATAVDNNVRLHLREEYAEGNVRDHVKATTATNNPVSVRFQSRNIQDDIAWVSWWSTFEPNVPPLSTQDIGLTKQEVTTALSWIQSNIGDSYDFELTDPDVTDAIQYVTHQTGQTVKVGLSAPLADHVQTLDVINISGNSFSGNNGDWAITQIYSDRLAIDITIPSASAANNTGASGALTRTLYARAVLVADDIRQVNFNLYRNSARNNPVTSFDPDWFDITSEAAPSGSVLNIGYNYDISITAPTIALQDDAGEFFAALGGPRRQAHLLFNGDPNDSGPTDPAFSIRRAIPNTFPVVNIQTQAAAVFFFNEQSDEIPVGESRIYRIYSDADNDGNDVTLQVGDNSVGFTEFFDGGIPQFPVTPGSYIDVEGYNDGTLHGWRFASPFQKVVPSINLYATPTAAFAGNIPIDLINQVPLLQSEDPSYIFVTSSSSKLLLKTGLEYRIEAHIDVLFNGAEGTGLLFLPVTLIPVHTRAGVDTDLPQYADNAPLLFSRNGQSGSSAPKFSQTLSLDFTWQSRPSDLIGFEIRFGAFPDGYSVSDIQFQNFRYTVTVQGGLD